MQPYNLLTEFCIADIPSLHNIIMGCLYASQVESNPIHIAPSTSSPFATRSDVDRGAGAVMQVWCDPIKDNKEKHAINILADESPVRPRIQEPKENVGPANQAYTSKEKNFTWRPQQHSGSIRAN